LVLLETEKSRPIPHIMIAVLVLIAYKPSQAVSIMFIVVPVKWTTFQEK